MTMQVRATMKLGINQSAVSVTQRTVAAYIVERRTPELSPEAGMPARSLCVL